MIHPHKKIKLDVSKFGMPNWSEKNVFYNVDYDEKNTTRSMLFLNSFSRNIIEQEKAKEKFFNDCIINNLTDIFYLLDINGRFLKWNKYLEIVLGYGSDEISKMNALEVFDYDEKEIIARKIEEVFAKGEAEVEANLVTKSGDKISYYFKAKSVDFEGTVCLVGSGIDITKRKKEEAIIEESEEKYRSFFENSLDAFLLVDVKGQIVDANPAAEALFEKKKAELCGARIYDFMAASDARTQRFLEEIQKTGRAKGELTILCGGIPRTCQLESVTYTEGKEEKTSVIVHNITEEKNLKKELVEDAKTMRDYNSRQETENEKELLLKELIKSNEDLKQFSFIASHNLRAPLSNIAGILDIIDYSTLDSYNRQMMEMLKVSGEQLSSTINNLSNILLIKNNTDVEISSIKIEDFYKIISKVFVNELDNACATVITDFKVSEVNFNETYLESIFINLISNAIKYRSSDRNLIIKISTYIDADGNCILAFSDNGIGIDLDKYRNKVFGLYQRFSSEIEGHGLGLFIIKNQINALGGSIEIESELGKGTTFEITFSNKI